MKKILIFLTALMTSVMLFSQNNRYIAFCAKEDGVGHAFISLGREDSEKLMTIYDGTWGLYPKEDKDSGKSFFIGEVPGEIRDDLLTKNDYTYIIIVSEDEYNQALQKVVEWQNKDYELLKNDCLSFLIDVANIVKEKIEIPERRGYKNLPAEYLKALINQNK